MEPRSLCGASLPVGNPPEVNRLVLPCDARGFSRHHTAAALQGCKVSLAHNDTKVTKLFQYTDYIFKWPVVLTPCNQSVFHLHELLQGAPLSLLRMHL